MAQRRYFYVVNYTSKVRATGEIYHEYEVVCATSAPAAEQWGEEEMKRRTEASYSTCDYSFRNVENISSVREIDLENGGTKRGCENEYNLTLTPVWEKPVKSEDSNAKG